MIRIPRRQLYKRNYLTIRFLAGIATILACFFIYFIIISLAPVSAASSLVRRNMIGSYISFFIPLNIISWLTLGQIGGVLVLIFSCFAIISIVLKYGILYFNIYILLFGVSAMVGYRIFLSVGAFRNQSLAKLESLENEKNVLSSRISQRQKDKAAAEKGVQRYAALKDITEDLSSALNLEKTTSLIVERAFNIIGKSDRALLFLIDEAKQELGLVASKQAQGLPPVKAKKGEIFDTWMIKQRKSLIIEDIENDFRFSPEALKDPDGREFKSIIGVPLMSEMKVSGVLRLDSREKTVYTQDDLRLLNIISNLAAVSIENSTLYKRMNDLAITDGLTGLYVQRYFKERLDIELRRALSGKRKFSVLMIDLDHFKECNDKYGHTAGDTLLIRVAQALKNSVSPGHIVSRYGGEEFAVFLFESDKTEAVKIAEGIRANVAGSVFTLRRHELRVTISIGVSSFPDDGYLAEVLLRKADENLYKAKQAGRNRVWSSPT